MAIQAFKAGGVAKKQPKRMGIRIADGPKPIIKPGVGKKTSVVKTKKKKMV